MVLTVSVEDKKCRRRREKVAGERVIEEGREKERVNAERRGERRRIKGISCRRPDEPDGMEKMFENIKVAGYDDYKN